MALATQCPHCNTTFKVAHDQLKLRSGLVRCGACKQIFNGIEHLVPPEQPAAPAHPFRSLPVEMPPKADTTLAAAAGISSGKPAAIQDSTPASINALEFIPVDDPETQTRILSPIEEAAPPALLQATPPTIEDEVDDDPLTRMTLVDFSVFDEDLHADDAPQKSAPATPAAPEEPIWPDTQDGEDKGDTLPGDMPAGTATPDAVSPPAQGLAEVTPEAEQDAGIREHAAAPREDAPATVTNAASPTAFADDGADSLSDTISPASALIDEDGVEEEEPTFVRRARRHQRWGRMTQVAMAFASVLLLAAALGQTAYAFRDQLAARFPAARPALDALCELARCQIGLPAQIEQVSIESNELQAQAGNKNVFTLSLLLHNRSAVAQSWPHVELTLNDKDGKPLVRRTLAPRDYLPADKLLQQGIAARSEQSVAVSFELSQLQASDYRVYLFYP